MELESNLWPPNQPVVGSGPSGSILSAIGLRPGVGFVARSRIGHSCVQVQLPNSLDKFDRHRFAVHGRDGPVDKRCLPLPCAA